MLRTSISRILKYIQYIAIFTCYGMSYAPELSAGSDIDSPRSYISARSEIDSVGADKSDVGSARSDPVAEERRYEYQDEFNIIDKDLQESAKIYERHV